MQQSSLLDGCLQRTGNLQSGSQGGGQTGLQTGLQTGFGAQAGAHAGAQTGAQAGAQTGAQHGSGAQHGADCSQTGAVSQHLLSAQPAHMSAVAHKKTNEAIIPSCFFISDSFRLFLVMVDLIIYFSVVI